MSDNTPIGWTDASFNIAWGCDRVSPGCAHCYAEKLASRYGQKGLWGRGTSRRRFGEKHWNEPRKWNREAEKSGIRKKVFCSSMSDIWEDHPTIDEEREKLWPLIRETPWLDWQLLTKRPHRIAETLPKDWGEGYPNVWLGTSVENQRWAGRAAILSAIPAVVRFVSCEPLLGPLDLRAEYGLTPSQILRVPIKWLDWVIVGGESGPGHRRMEIAWAERIQRDCAEHGVSFFMKQDSGSRAGMKNRIPDHLWVHEFPTPRVLEAAA